MSALVSLIASMRWCVAARSEGAAVHLVARTTLPPYGPIHDSKALCGAAGYVDRFGRPRWSRTRRPGKTHCQRCFSLAYDPSLNVRIDWQ